MLQNKYIGVFKQFSVPLMLAKRMKNLSIKSTRNF